MARTSKKRRVAPGLWQLEKDKFEFRVKARSSKTGLVGSRWQQFDGTKAEALIEREKARAELAANEPVKVQRRETVESFARSWMSTGLALRRWSPSTVDRYTTALDQHILNTVGLDGQIRPALGQMILANLEKPDVVGWFKAEAERWEATSCNGWLRVLVSLLNDAVDDKLIARNVAALVKPIPEDEHPDEGDNTFEPEELGAIIEEWRRRCALVWPDAPEYLHPRFHGRHRRDLKVQGFLIVLAAAVTGMRWGEVTALQPADLDKAERDGALLVRRAHYRGQLKGTKGRRRRSVPWPRALSELFREYQRWMVAVEHPGIAAGYLFTTEKGTLLANGSLSEEWREVLKAVSIERRVTFHGLRHTMTDLLRQAGVDSFIRQSIVGHESEAMQRRYSKVRPEEARAAGEQALRLIPGGVHSGVHLGEEAEEAAEVKTTKAS